PVPGLRDPRPDGAPRLGPPRRSLRDLQRRQLRHPPTSLIGSGGAAMNMSEIPWHAQKLLALRERVLGLDTRVPVLDGSLRPYINLDNAASTPVLRDVMETVERFMDWYSSVHRGAGFKSRVATHAYEDARRIVADFVGADLREHVVVFGKNATEGIN